MCAMYRILVNTEYLKQISGQLWSYTEQIRTLEARLNSSFMSLDWEGQDRALIESQVAQLHSQSAALIALTEKMARLVTTKNQGFEETDRQSAASLFPGSPNTPPAQEIPARTRINLNSMLKKPEDQAVPVTDAQLEAPARQLDLAGPVDLAAPPQADLASQITVQDGQLQFQVTPTDQPPAEQAPADQAQTTEAPDLAQALTVSQPAAEDPAAQAAADAQPAATTEGTPDIAGALNFGLAPEQDQPADAAPAPQDAPPTGAVAEAPPAPALDLGAGLVSSEGATQPPGDTAQAAAAPAPDQPDPNTRSSGGPG